MPLILGYCEIYKPEHHGHLNDHHDKKHIYTNLLFQLEISLEENYDNSINSLKQEWELNGPWRFLNFLNNSNPYIKNTNAIKLNDLHILELIYYNEYVFCIIKTFWLKIFQRKFKRYYKNLLIFKKNFKNILNRQVKGKW
tara:strand:- start:1016 stop:1435 length:420 start_codon:yes stop_codon:yes gene_type:complete